ncbi:MAG: calcium incorporation protein MxaA [Gammaproteobacteria bacterium]
MRRMRDGLALPVTASALLLSATIAAGVPTAPTADGHGAAAAANATVEQPRPFGYVVGDLLTQRVLLQLDGDSFEPAALPRPERLDVWWERRQPRIETSADGRRWLAVDYQLINAPQTLALVSLPAWELKPASGATPLRIGAWPVSVAALTPRRAFANSDLGELRPDRAAPLIATAPIRRQLEQYSAALLLTLGAWLGWLLWRNQRAAARQPFARARRELRQIDDTSPQAWQALHRAFDQTAGRVVQLGALPVLFQQAPQLAPLRGKIEQFFTQSSERFFGSGPAGDPLPLRALCDELRRIEKRFER